MYNRQTYIIIEALKIISDTRGPYHNPSLHPPPHSQKVSKGFRRNSEALQVRYTCNASVLLASLGSGNRLLSGNTSAYLPLLHKKNLGEASWRMKMNSVE